MTFPFNTYTIFPADEEADEKLIRRRTGQSHVPPREGEPFTILDFRRGVYYQTTQVVECEEVTPDQEWHIRTQGDSMFYIKKEVLP